MGRPLEVISPERTLPSLEYQDLESKHLSEERKGYSVVPNIFSSKEHFQLQKLRITVFHVISQSRKHLIVFVQYMALNNKSITGRRPHDNALRTTYGP